MPTVRQRLIKILQTGFMTTFELSQALRIREKDIPDHLEHIARSITSKGLKLEIQPSRCFSCGFIFAARQRFTKPGRCPQCKETGVSHAGFRLVSVNNLKKQGKQTVGAGGDDGG